MTGTGVSEEMNHVRTTGGCVGDQQVFDAQAACESLTHEVQPLEQHAA